MNIKLKDWEFSDLEFLVKYANNKNISNNLADSFPTPYTANDGMEFIQRVSNHNPRKIFAIVFDKVAVGSIGCFPDSDIHRKNAAIAYWVAEPYWGKGIATESIKLMVDYGFKAFDIDRIYAKPFGRNKASHRALVKAGFKLEATIEKTIFKNGEYLDELIFGYRKKY